jgi:polar amino acid transport system permease protein
VAELCWQAQQIESLTFRGFEATTAASVLYLGLSLFISWIMNMINAKLRVDEEHHVHGMTRWLADRVFYPFGLAWRCLAGLCRVATSTSRAAGLRYTRSALVWKRVTTIVWHMVSFSAKSLFLVGLLLLLFQVGKGLLAFNWQIIAENLRTLLIWRFPSDEPGTVLWGLGGLAYSVLMAVIAISVSFFIGLFVGLGRMSKNVFFRLPSQLYIEIIRGNPLILIIFWVYFFVPIFINAYLDVFWSATIALTLFTGAYIAEIVRGGIQNIPRGQFEAAYGTGLGYGSTMIYIVLPQALKQMIPAIVGQFIAIFKDTSLAFVIGVLELTFVAQGLNNRLMVYPFEIYTTVAALYFICCYSMSIVASRLEARLSPEKARLVM